MSTKSPSKFDHFSNPTPAWVTTSTAQRQAAWGSRTCLLDAEIGPSFLFPRFQKITTFKFSTLTVMAKARIRLPDESRHTACTHDGLPHRRFSQRRSEDCMTHSNTTGCIARPASCKRQLVFFKNDEKTTVAAICFLWQEMCAAAGHWTRGGGLLLARRPRHPELHRSSAARDPEARVVLSERRFATSSAARACHTRCLLPAVPCTRACSLYLGLARAVALHLLPRFRRFLAFRSRCFSPRPSSHFGKCVLCCRYPCTIYGPT